MTTSRERMLTALAGGRADRLPATVHQWQAFHLEEFLGGITALEAFARFGLDAAIPFEQPDWGYWLPADRLRALSTDTWRHTVEIAAEGPDGTFRRRHRVETPDGILEFTTAGDRRTTWVTGYPLQAGADLAPLGHLPVPALDLVAARRQAAAVGERGILRGILWGDQPGCWQHACCLVEPAELILACFDRPAWVHALLERLLAKKLRFIATMAGAPFDLVETGGGSASTTVISPALHREFCLPYDRRLHAALAGTGFRVVYHICGGNRGLEEMILANGCHAAETLAPPSVGGNQEPWEFAARMQGKVALIGGLDQAGLLTEGTPERIAAKVQELFAKVGAAGGYILSPSDHFFAAPPANLEAFARAARACCY